MQNLQCNPVFKIVDLDYIVCMVEKIIEPLMLNVHKAEQHKAVGSRESQIVVRFYCLLAGISGPWTANSVSLESYNVYTTASSLNPTDDAVNGFTYTS